MIKIGDLAKICNVSTQTLRYYDSEGVLKADITDSLTGYRFYSVDAVEKYKQILFYKNLGFSLVEIKRIQSATSEQLRDILQMKKENLSESIDRFKNYIKMIDDICDINLKKPVLSDVLLLPFDDDPQVIGKWKLCGKLLDENELTALQEVKTEMADKEIIFMPGGAFAWKYFWTKGTLYRISPKYTFAVPNLYKTVEQNGTRYMIVQFMSDDCIDYGKDTTMLLYRQVNNVAYTEHQIRPNIDKTDLPFVDDESVHGDWIAIDFVPAISDFNYNSRYSDKEDIYTVDIRFLSRGKINSIVDEIISIDDKQSKTAARSYPAPLESELEILYLLILTDKVSDTAELKRLENLNTKTFFIEFILPPDTFDFNCVDFSNYMWVNFARQPKYMDKFIKSKEILIPKIQHRVKIGDASEDEKKYYMFFT